MRKRILFSYLIYSLCCIAVVVVFQGTMPDETSAAETQQLCRLWSNQRLPGLPPCPLLGRTVTTNLSPHQYGQLSHYTLQSREFLINYPRRRERESLDQVDVSPSRQWSGSSVSVRRRRSWCRRCCNNVVFRIMWFSVLHISPMLIINNCKSQFTAYLLSCWAQCYERIKTSKS